MRIPVLRGVIDRRLLVNFRVDPDVLARVLPSPFRPMLANGMGMAGIGHGMHACGSPHGTDMMMTWHGGQQPIMACQGLNMAHGGIIGPACICILAAMRQKCAQGQNSSIMARQIERQIMAQQALP